MKTVGATEFKANCLRLIGQMSQDHEPVTITKRGQPVAVLFPLPPTENSHSIIGAMGGSVQGYDDPFEPAGEPSEWNVNR